MIPQVYIIEWQQSFPWNSYDFVEQDLVISRALVEIYSDSFLKNKLAFRGGTALHKLHLAPQVRYSEDIDLVQITAEPIGNIIDALRNKLSFLGKPKKILRNDMNTTMRFDFDSEIPPVAPLKLKIETNCREHFQLFGLQYFPFSVQSRWFTRNCEISTYALEELLGTKIRALYQRKKGRDLFDLWYALKSKSLDKGKIIQSFQEYMKASGNKVSQTEYIISMEDKMLDSDFRNDIISLLRPETKYNIDEAWALVKSELIVKI
jgi:predicted nucleotidyltransferase component of viral defense system